MRPRPLILVIPLIFTLFSFAFAQDGGQSLSAQIAGKNTEIKQIEAEIRKFQDNLAVIGKETNTLSREINRIDAEIGVLNSQISLTQVKISKQELEINRLGGDIASTQRSFNEHRLALAANLRQLREIEANTSLEAFLLYHNVSDFFDAVEQNKRLSEGIGEKLTILVSTKELLTEQRTNAETARRDLLALTNKLRDQKAINADQKNDKANLLRATKNEEAQYQVLLKNREAERERILEEIQRIEDELRGLINPAGLPSPRSGVLGWPIQGAVLTQSFGVTLESKILYNGQPHNGIDIRAGVGTPIFAAEDGEIIQTGDTDLLGRGTSRPCLSYGKWILIKHPNNLSTLYAHLSLIRTHKGDTVKRGEIIGYSGSTGYATGPHLHFTVYDSNTVRFGPSSIATSNCSFLPFGGYLNPLAYL